MAILQAVSVDGIPAARPAVATAGPLRGALRALLGRRAAIDTGELAGLDPAEATPRLATGFENRVRLLRANAHAAYRSVKGDPGAALDAALAVIEAEWNAARAQRDSYGEALKSIRLYTQDRRARALAERALDGRSEPAVIPCAAADSGAIRFPFEDDFDA